MKPLSAFVIEAVANRSTLHNRPTIVPAGTLFSRSWNQSMAIWLRNMCGTEFDLGARIRSQAQMAFLYRKNVLQVLEITAGMPLKALELRGYGFRKNGDFLEYYERPGHPKTAVESTVISDWDWVQGLLEGELELSDSDTHDILTQFIMPAFDCLAAGYNAGDPSGMFPKLRAMYRELKKSGKVTLLCGTNNSIINHVTTLVRLEELFQSKKRFDLVFVDPHATQDKFLCLMGVQKVLAPHGIGYLPINWWSPRSLTERLGVEEWVIWNEKVGSENLEDYLVRNYPDAFAIAYFTGAKTLVIKGTSTPVDW